MSRPGPKLCPIARARPHSSAQRRSPARAESTTLARAKAAAPQHLTQRRCSHGSSVTRPTTIATSSGMPPDHMMSLSLASVAKGLSLVLSIERVTACGPTRGTEVGARQGERLNGRRGGGRARAAPSLQQVSGTAGGALRPETGSRTNGERWAAEAVGSAAHLLDECLSQAAHWVVVPAPKRLGVERHASVSGPGCGPGPLNAAFVHPAGHHKQDTVRVHVVEQPAGPGRKQSSSSSS